MLFLFVFRVAFYVLNEQHFLKMKTQKVKRKQISHHWYVSVWLYYEICYSIPEVFNNRIYSL